VSKSDLISHKLEDYLEVIFQLVAEKHVARVSDIAGAMGVQMPTVTGALKHLSQHGLVNYEPYQYVTLTPEGVGIARGMIRRHDVLKRFMGDVLSLPEDIAEHDACGMEHALSDAALDRLIEFLEFIGNGPRAGDGLVEQFRRFRDEERTACGGCAGQQGGDAGPDSGAEQQEDEHA
jgi:DtxR family Mn-dependent transcriptional regulator